ncbi:MAG: hypothetical protein IIY87_05195 [Bacteroidales bacterium]|jgi:hypothetical protein|nr:hypothetical protein [Bacteroidales bacterium]
MKTRIYVIILAVVAMFAGCKEYDDFDFAGTVVDYEECNGISEMGYAIELSSPDTLGGDYTTHSGKEYHNVVVVYGSDRLLKENSKVSGRIYIDNDYSRSTCNYHYTDRDVPEAVFTKLKVES